MVQPVRPREGMGVLHLFYRVRHDRVNDLPPGAAKDLQTVLEGIVEDTQTHVFGVLGHKADIMVMALDEDLSRLRQIQTRIDACDAASALQLSYSYLSLTETSEYTPTPEEQRARFEAEGMSGDDLERRAEKEAERLAEYNRHKLYPDMPSWEVACFYPMSHRRDGDDNWYSLPFEERRRLMHEHGKSGRAYTGRVLQLVAGSTGLDDWEWGVTLFAHDIADIKDIVYTMRYDEASARFAEFGPFLVGLRRSPADLVRDVGLAHGETTTIAGPEVDD